MSSPLAQSEPITQGPPSPGDLSRTLSESTDRHEDAHVAHDTPPLPAAIGDLHDVMMSLKRLVDWQSLGLALGLLYPTLEIIETGNRGFDTCKRKMLAAWLHRQDHVRQKGVPSWLVLQAALQEIGENELAGSIVSRLLTCLHVCA